MASVKLAGCNRSRSSGRRNETSARSTSPGKALDDVNASDASGSFGPLAARDPNTELQVKSSGLHHVAFTFESLGAFLDNYVRLKERGVRPFFCVNHGPTTSMYYRGPDGNRVELQIDNFATAEEGQAWMHSPAFDRNPIGVEYDPDELVKKFKSGVPVAELVARGD